MEETQTESGTPAQTVAPLSKIEEAKALVERIEKANADFANLLERQELLRVNQMLSGTAEAGKAPEVKVESNKEYAERISRGQL